MDLPHFGGQKNRRRADHAGPLQAEPKKACCMLEEASMKFGFVHELSMAALGKAAQGVGHEGGGHKLL